MKPSGTASGERVFEALRLLKRGDALGAIAERLPNYGSGGERGLSDKSVEIVLRSGVRTLLTLILLDRRPAHMPDEIWPPDEVRHALRAASSPARRKAMLRATRAWLENRDFQREIARV